MYGKKCIIFSLLILFYIPIPIVGNYQKEECIIEEKEAEFILVKKYTPNATSHFGYSTTAGFRNFVYVDSASKWCKFEFDSPNIIVYTSTDLSGDNWAVSETVDVEPVAGGAHVIFPGAMKVELGTGAGGTDRIHFAFLAEIAGPLFKTNYWYSDDGGENFTKTQGSIQDGGVGFQEGGDLPSIFFSGATLYAFFIRADGEIFFADLSDFSVDLQQSTEGADTVFVGHEDGSNYHYPRIRTGTTLGEYYFNGTAEVFVKDIGTDLNIEVTYTLLIKRGTRKWLVGNDGNDGVSYYRIGNGDYVQTDISGAGIVTVAWDEADDNEALFVIFDGTDDVYMLSENGAILRIDNDSGLTFPYFGYGKYLQPYEIAPITYNISSAKYKKEHNWGNSWETAKFTHIGSDVASGTSFVLTDNDENIESILISENRSDMINVQPLKLYSPAKNDMLAEVSISLEQTFKEIMVEDLGDADFLYTNGSGIDNPAGDISAESGKRFKGPRWKLYQKLERAKQKIIYWNVQGLVKANDADEKQLLIGPDFKKIGNIRGIDDWGESGDPDGWVITEGGTTEIEIVTEEFDHVFPMKFTDPGAAQDAIAGKTFDAGAQTSGAVEFWVHTGLATTELLAITLTNGSIAAGNRGPEIHFFNDGFIKYLDVSTTFQTIQAWTANTWYHIRVEFECGAGGAFGLTADHMNIDINTLRVETDVEFRNVQAELSRLFYFTGFAQSANFLVDSVGFSWESYIKLSNYYLRLGNHEVKLHPRDVHYQGSRVTSVTIEGGRKANGDFAEVTVDTPYANNQTKVIMKIIDPDMIDDAPGGVMEIEAQAIADKIDQNFRYMKFIVQNRMKPNIGEVIGITASLQSLSDVDHINWGYEFDPNTRVCLYKEYNYFFIHSDYARDLPEANRSTIKQVSEKTAIVVKTTTGDPADPFEGQIYINTFDNAMRAYADGAWRDLATW